MKPLCFVLMPFGSKPDPTGRPNIDFDPIYKKAIEPAILDAGLEPIRGDQESLGGIIHKPMFERLLLCEYAVADLTTANANVFYELGVRHAARRSSTQAIFAKHQPIPFDVANLRALPYDLGKNNRFAATEAKALHAALLARLIDLRKSHGADEPPIDSPIFQLIQDWKPGKIARRKTEVFVEQVQEDKRRKARMTEARDLPRAQALVELKSVEDDIAEIDLHEIGSTVDLMLAYRAIKAWTEMISLYDKMPGELKRQIMVREQLAMALNRRAGDESRKPDERQRDRKRATRLLLDVIDQQGPSSETNGLLGRIYKDMWLETGERAYLRKAAEVYSEGFRTDWRDAFPGVNAATLFDILGDTATRDEIVPVVRFAVLQRLRSRTPDYWDYASMLELAVLAGRIEEAQEYLGKAMTSVREVWEPETTARNLGMIRKARGGDLGWLDKLIQDLQAIQ